MTSPISFGAGPALRAASVFCHVAEQSARLRVCQLMMIEVEKIPDDLLEAAAQREGPDSVEAEILDTLRAERARDRQVHALRIGRCWITGPIPDARTELVLIKLAEEGGL
jgi:hypothetical protein